MGRVQKNLHSIHLVDVTKAIEADSDLTYSEIVLVDEPFDDWISVSNVRGRKFKLYINKVDDNTLEDILLALRGKKVIKAVEEIV